MTPTVAVLITYFNEGPLLADCLASLAAQTEPPDEIIVYDDASDDPAAAYLPPGTKARVLRGETNKGPSAGRNVLLAEAESEYVHFHDADDLLAPDWCAQVRRAIHETDADLVLTEVQSRDETGVLAERMLGLASQRPDDTDALVRFCLRGAVITSASVTRATAARAIGGFREDLRQSEDYDFHVRLSASGVRWAAIAEPLVVKRIRAQSHSSRDWVRVWRCAVESIQGLSGLLAPRFGPDLSEAAARAGSTLYRLGAHGDARAAFRLADQLGPPTYEHERPLYRAIARSLGPVAAERAGFIYRHLPARVRARLQ